MSSENQIDDGSTAVALYRRFIEVSLIGGIHSRRGWGGEVRDRILPVLRQHSKLRHHSGILADCTSCPQAGGADAASVVNAVQARTRYADASQAVREAAAILRQEAAVWEGNIDRYQQNLETAQTFTERANKIIRDAQASAEQSIRAAGDQAVRQTANLTGSDGVPLFDEAARVEEMHRAGEQVAGRLQRSLCDELAAVQGRICSRGYVEQTYDGGDQVVSSSQLPSLQHRIDSLAPYLQQLPAPRRMAVPVESGSLMEAGRWVCDHLARATGWFPERTEQEKQHDKRRPVLEECLSRLAAEAADFRQNISRIFENAVEEATRALQREVERCFAQEFESASAARIKIARWRQQADALRVPPPLLHSLTHIWRELGVGCEAEIGTPAGSEQTICTYPK